MTMDKDVAMVAIVFNKAISRVEVSDEVFSLVVKDGNALVDKGFLLLKIVRTSGFRVVRPSRCAV